MRLPFLTTYYTRILVDLWGPKCKSWGYFQVITFWFTNQQDQQYSLHSLETLGMQRIRQSKYRARYGRFSSKLTTFLICLITTKEEFQGIYAASNRYLAIAYFQYHLWVVKMEEQKDTKGIPPAYSTICTAVRKNTCSQGSQYLLPFSAFPGSTWIEARNINHIKITWTKLKRLEEKDFRQALLQQTEMHHAILFSFAWYLHCPTINISW